MKKIIICLLGVFALLNLYGCTNKKTEDNKNVVSTFELHKMNIDIHDDFVGLICEKESKKVVGEYNGLVPDKVNVIKGQAVKKGDVICTFDTEDLKKRIIYLKKILSGDFWGMTDVENTLYSEDYFSFESDNQIRTEIKKLESLQESPYIKAECKGIITNLYVTAGEKIFDNMIAELGVGKQIVIYVSDKQQLEYKKGMKVRIFSQTENSKFFEGQVSEVEDYKEEAGYPVYINFEADSLYIGSKVGVQLVSDFRKDVYAVPYHYLKQDENGQYILSTNNVKIYVNEGLVTDYYVEIKSDSLKQGEKIIINEE